MTPPEEEGLPDDLPPIAPAGEGEGGDRRERLKLALRDLLDAGGALARHQPGFEPRPQQLAMADLVADALVDGAHAVVEAGTGTGKTLAYLVPAILSGKKTVVATATKALQEQLVEKDLPLLHRLGLDFTHAVMKGRANYLCLVRFQQFDGAPSFASRGEEALYPRLRAWAAATATGDRAELDLPDGYAAWREVSATYETCLGQKCPRFADCHVTRMRQKAEGAEVVVVNHHLFLADLALRRSSAAKAGVEVVPRSQAVILDEAHNLEEVATEFFGVQLSNWRIFDLCRDVDRLGRLRPSWPGERLSRLTSGLGRSTEAFFEEVGALDPGESNARSHHDRPARGELPLLRRLDPAAGEGMNTSSVLPDARWSLTPGMLEQLFPARGELEDDLRALKELLVEIGGGEPEVDLVALARRCDELEEALELVTVRSQPELVYWAERRGRGVFLRASPVDVAGELSASLFCDDRAVVLTSATLATGGSTAFFEGRVGLSDSPRTRRLVLGSPFDYESQAALYLPAHLPEPSSDEFAGRAAEELAALVALAGGRTFALFTSLKAMRQLHARLKDRLPYRVLLQGERPKSALVRAFREEPSVLFATQSFWEGVDVPGDELSLVVIDKLPFASPADPLVAARLKAIDERGGSSFAEYSLPAAAISLRQGFGRLIRSRADTGAVAILDRRLWTKSYGAFLRRSLPSCPTFRDFADLKRWWSRTRPHEPACADLD